MSNRPFDAHEAARDREAAVIERAQAEAIAQAVGRDGEQLATRSDFEGLESRFLTKSDLERFKVDFYRTLWIHGGSIVAGIAALEFLA